MKDKNKENCKHPALQQYGDVWKCQRCDATLTTQEAEDRITQHLDKINKEPILST